MGLMLFPVGFLGEGCCTLNDAKQRRTLHLLLPEHKDKGDRPSTFNKKKKYSGNILEM